MEGKYLITTNCWFYAPDGAKYKAVWGDVEIVEDAVLGVKTNRNSSNWFVKVGKKDSHVLISGCQIHYAVKCKTKPHDGDVIEMQYTPSDSHAFNRPCEIYIAQ